MQSSIIGLRPSLRPSAQQGLALKLQERRHPCERSTVEVTTFCSFQFQVAPHSKTAERREKAVWQRHQSLRLCRSTPHLRIREAPLRSPQTLCSLEMPALSLSAGVDR